MLPVWANPDSRALAEEDLVAIGHIKEFLETSVEWPSASHKLVALLIAYHADRKWGMCRLTQSELGEASVLSRRRIADILDDLCNLGVIARLQHGRYGIRFGLAQEGRERLLPQPKGVDKELERIKGIVAEERAAGEQLHGIAFNWDGWPVLTKLSDYDRGSD